MKNRISRHVADANGAAPAPEAPPQPASMAVEVPLGKCPHCGAHEAFVKEPMIVWAITGEQINARNVGSKLQCRKCETIYSVGPGGIVTHWQPQVAK